MFSIVTSGIFMFAFFIIYAQLSDMEKLGPKDKQGQMSIKLVVCLGIFALLIRLCAAPFTSGHPTDIKCWTYWGHRLYSVGPQNFYAEGIFADYPPGYMYILWLIGSIVGTLKLPAAAALALYKLPAILGDIGVAFAIYNIAKKHLNGKIACVLFFFVAFNPLSYFNSVIWGQMDSLLVLTAIISLYALYEEKHLKAAVFLVISALLKPQALMFAPIYLFAFIEKKDLKLTLKTIGICLGLVLIIAYPFSPAHQGSEGLILRLLKAINPLWLLEKYASTLGSYDYASINAFNFPALVGGNWKEASSPFLFLPWKAWGYITIAFAIGFSGVIYFKAKDRWTKIFLPAFFIIAFLFAFGTKMHERYIYPAIITLLIFYIFTKKRSFLWLFSGLSIINLVNLDYVFYCATNGNIAPKYLYVALIALFQVTLILLSLYLIYHTCFKKSNISAHKTENNVIKNRKMTKQDWIAVSVITLLYSIIAFSNVGDTTAPQTFANAKDNQRITITLENEMIIDEIACYFGISDVKTPAGFSISTSTDGEHWVNLKEKCSLNGVFRWTFTDISKKAKYIRLTPTTDNYSIGEIGFLNKYGEIIDIQSVSNDSVFSNAFDEQQLIPYEYSYKNSTYFDEIYHPRSAYELLFGLDYYETTHPPLGKIIISLGIAIFGMTPFGWRFTGILFGILMLPALYLFLKKLFKKTSLCAIGTLLFAADFMHYSLTRLGTIDSYPVFFIILMYLCMYVFTSNLKHNLKEYGKDFIAQNSFKEIYAPLLLCGIFSGLGIASKWIAIYALAGIAVLFFIEFFIAAKSLGIKSGEFKSFSLKIGLWCVLCFIVIPFTIYLLSYIPVANSQNKGLFEAMIDSQKYMLSYHGGLNATHPYSSKWYEWGIIAKPLLTYYQTNGAKYHSAMTIMGNPILWWSGLICIIYSVYRGIKTKNRAVLFIVIGLLSQLLPWVFVSRCTFIYHFFASVPFMIMLIVYSIKELTQMHPKAKYLTAVFVALCVISFALFYPVLTGVEVSNDYTESVLKWFNSWIF